MCFNIFIYLFTYETIETHVHTFLLLNISAVGSVNSYKVRSSVSLLLFFQSNGSILIEIQLLINLAVELQGQRFSKAIFFCSICFGFFHELPILMDSK